MQHTLLETSQLRQIVVHAVVASQEMVANHISFNAMSKCHTGNPTHPDHMVLRQHEGVHHATRTLF